MALWTDECLPGHSRPVETQDVHSKSDGWASQGHWDPVEVQGFLEATSGVKGHGWEPCAVGTPLVSMGGLLLRDQGALGDLCEK